MSNAASRWTLDGFVDHFDFVHHKMLDHKFVWVLGAGASHASGIPVGSQLVEDWLMEMHRREDGENKSLKDWATLEKLEIKDFNFDSRASFYSKIYQRRFRDYPEEGYAYLESVMSGKDPSPGYSILASALAEDPPRHNVVITTNFDNLVADALAIYTDTFPFVAGHESLTSFVRVSMRRPLICKIHRDLLLGPQNDPRSLKRLHDAWGIALRALFQHYTPLFIGYGGNDDTLMDLLESLQQGDIKGTMVWCYYENQDPSERIVDVVAGFKGVLVPVPDFDLLMVLLGEKMGISTLDQEIGLRASVRAQRYRDRIQRLDTVGYPSVAKALAATFERSGGSWAWEQKAQLETDLDRREVVYRQGIELCPLSGELNSAFGWFMWIYRQNSEEAERLFLKAIELSPNSAFVLNAWGLFLSLAKADHKKAESALRMAVDVDEHPDILGNLAFLLGTKTGKKEEAERMFSRAIKLDPQLGYNYSKYGNYLLASGRIALASEILKLGKQATTGQDDRLTAGFAFYSAVLARAKGEDDTAEIETLKAMFSKGFRRGVTDLGGVLEYVRKTLSARDHAFFSALADGFSLAGSYPNVNLLLQSRDTSKKRPPRKRSKRRGKHI